ncbi:DUF2959 domain-containing protein [Thalassotalea insulae]|uniref:DUF2959 domain-containing protein n=1 Tax=Thalassotalea insulae TaxID=2056778 RepID=A0ABQ6GR31_9GAMM|nr:DUF2959 domain-containing protein [Thalassotalea insulae]GLX78089.1 DUF2959 domain-containing protein [Thalassotalea insulae]
MKAQQNKWLSTGLAILLLSTIGCQSAYYSAMEKVGLHKRDILIDRVEKASDSQQEAKQEFKSALEQLTTLINFDGGDLQSHYQQSETHYQASLQAAEEVNDRISAIEDVAQALFDEWQEEITQYSSASLKRQSQSKLISTQGRYNTLLKAMHKAADKMPPILATLKDNTLFLKHNLNAQAIGALKGEYQGLKQDINVLINEMNKAISNSQLFIDSLKTSG